MGKKETRNIDRLHISYLVIQDFYRIRGKEKNFDIYKKDGVWLNVYEPGLSRDILQLVGMAIDEAENKTGA